MAGCNLQVTQSYSKTLITTWFWSRLSLHEIIDKHHAHNIPILINFLIHGNLFEILRTCLGVFLFTGSNICQLYSNLSICVLIKKFNNP